MSTTHLALVKLVLCGPSDVATEISIAQKVIEEWNLQHGEARGFWVKHYHWLTDTYPDLSDRPQDVVNRQIIDNAQILIAVFWSRFGTPTGVADSGTEEELLRAAEKGRKVLVYFSDLEPKPANADAQQLDLLWQFRQKIRLRGLCCNFQSRQEFRSHFMKHLTLVLNAFDALRPPKKPARKRHKSIKQVANGSGNTQIVGDGNKVYQRPPKEVIVTERRPGSVTTDEENQIGKWIERLAEGEVDKTRKEAFGEWWGRFHNRFVKKTEDLPSTRMPEVEAWYRQQAAIQKGDLKTKAPDSFRRERVGAIKAAMRTMRRTNEDYYPELSQRLKLKKPFTSTNQLTTRNLGRVYSMVKGDLRKSGGSF